MKRNAHMFYLLFTMFLLVFPIVADTRMADSDEAGFIVYSVNGSDDDVSVDIMVISNLENRTNANQWEVSVMIVVSDANYSYNVHIIDNHMALSTDSSGEVLDSLQRESIGSRYIGPFFVFAIADPSYGDLYWDVIVKDSRDREIINSLRMVWGYGVDPPPRNRRIIEEDESNRANFLIFQRNFSWLDVILGMISLVITLLITRSRQDDSAYSSKFGGDGSL